VGVLSSLLRGRIPVGKYRRASGGVRQVQLTASPGALRVGGRDLGTALILVIEDEQDIQSLIEDALTEGGFEKLSRRGNYALEGVHRKVPCAHHRRKSERQVGRLGGRSMRPRDRTGFPLVYMSGTGCGASTANPTIQCTRKLSPPKVSPKRDFLRIGRRLSGIPPGWAALLSYRYPARI
jgi:hypothetical protein